MFKKVGCLVLNSDNEADRSMGHRTVIQWFKSKCDKSELFD